MLLVEHFFSPEEVICCDDTEYGTSCGGAQVRAVTFHDGTTAVVVGVPLLSVPVRRAAVCVCWGLLFREQLRELWP